MKKKINKRVSEALTPIHYLAYMLHPSNQGEKLSAHEEFEAMEWAMKHTLMPCRILCGIELEHLNLRNSV